MLVYWDDFRTELPSPEILQGCIKAIIQAFENVGEMEGGMLTPQM
jgi:hypothetical protein